MNYEDKLDELEWVIIDLLRERETPLRQHVVTKVAMRLFGVTERTAIRYAKHMIEKSVVLVDRGLGVCFKD